MDLLVVLALGGLVGWLVSLLDGRQRHPNATPYVLLGVVGSVAGDWLAGVLGLAGAGTPARWLLALVGAFLLLGLFQMLSGSRPPVRPA